VKELGVDFLGAGVLKYLLGSAGLGFLYCRRELVERSGRRRPAGSPTRTSSRWTSHDYSPAPTARALPVGHAAGPAIYAGIAGIELMQEIGIAETREHVNGSTSI
jgi:selenocysteine lyase/cysteine desulfurase